MSGNGNGDSKNIDLYYEKLFEEAERSGYHLNPNTGFSKALVTGLLTNLNRYGYACCPCRLASGKKEEDIDIICPCDYRDADLGEYGCCFCALYVTEAVLKGDKDLSSIPERRPDKNSRKRTGEATDATIKPPLPVWRCRVCGYLCGREEPPGTCPICKASKERFERFL